MSQVAAQPTVRGEIGLARNLSLFDVTMVGVGAPRRLIGGRCDHHTVVENLGPLLALAADVNERHGDQGRRGRH